MSHSQLPVLFLLTVQNFSIFGCKEYNQSNFGIDHLVMSMCKVSHLLCCWKRVFAMTNQCVLLAKLCQPLSCFILYSKAKLACYSRYLLTSCFCIPVHYNEKDIFFGWGARLVLKDLVSLHRTIQPQLLWHSWFWHRLGSL